MIPGGSFLCLCFVTSSDKVQDIVALGLDKHKMYCYYAALKTRGYRKKRGTPS